MNQTTSPIAPMEFGDATAAVVVQDRGVGMELWKVHDRGRLWTTFHETYVFCWAHHISAEQAWLYRGKRYAATTQTTMLIEPGEVHRTIKSGPAGFHLLWVKPSLVATFLDSHPLHFREGQTSEVLVAHHFANLISMYESAPCNRLAKEEVILHFLHMLARVCANQFPNQKHPACHRAVNLVREYIHAHYTDDLCLDELAIVAGLSKYHLSRIFKSTVGVPLHRYQTLVRMEKAREKLLRGETIIDVALDAGYYDQSHFHHAFLKAYGITPRRYCLPMSHLE
jgi:AraC-like DNA-binding protein